MPPRANSAKYGMWLISSGLSQTAFSIKIVFIFVWFSHEQATPLINNFLENHPYLIHNCEKKYPFPFSKKRVSKKLGDLYEMTKEQMKFAKFVFPNVWIILQNKKMWPKVYILSPVVFLHMAPILTLMRQCRSSLWKKVPHCREHWTWSQRDYKDVLVLFV